ncbi:hypothetical protein [Catellatospora tritici]|uniref:hypothetical protein n=1 Tax=Catellatospora tritici TaxID=2851566 RepID=UPI001C2CDC10|nr:hypothetical protein [Catellatospora tritici]MBV1848971.1 hypothetical protein [Catellatospora tritici]
MIDLDDELRRGFRELAEHGRPVDLGTRAVAAVRRRRLLRAVGAGAVVLAVLAVLTPLYLLRGARQPQPPAEVAASVTVSPTPDAPPTPTARSPRSVIGAYADSGGTWWLLDPNRGRYEQLDRGFSVLAVSPRLDRAVVRQGSRLGIRQTATGRLDFVNLGVARAGQPVWSPDGERVALPVPDQRGLFTAALVLDPDRLAVTRIDLSMSPGRLAFNLSWLGDALLAATTDARWLGSDGSLSGASDVVYAVSDLTGHMVLDRGIPTGMAPESHLWVDSGIVAGETSVVSETLPGRVNLALCDLGPRQQNLFQVVSLREPDLAAGQTWTVRVLGLRVLPGRGRAEVVLEQRVTAGGHTVSWGLYLAGPSGVLRQAAPTGAAQVLVVPATDVPGGALRLAF